MATLISEQEYEAALAKGRAELTQPHAIAARYVQAERKITIVFSNGLEFSLRPENSDFLRAHAGADLSDPYVTPGGDGLVFDAAGLSVSIPGLLAQLLPESIARKQFASAMGARTSERKAEAARANGAKGGRPKRQMTEAVSVGVAIPDAMTPVGIWSYRQIAEQIARAREHLATQGVKLHPQSTLASVFRNGVQLSEDWDAGMRDASTAGHLTQAAFALRISQAILTLNAKDLASELLRRVAKKNLDLAQRGPSQGKDALWELELLARLRALGAQALVGEPDILVELEGARYAIACKKIYTAARLEDALRSGISQLAQFGGVGLVAINVDELLPPPQLIHSARSAQDLSDRLALFLASPPDGALALMRGLVADRRCDGVLLSATVLSHIEEGRAGLNLQTQYSIFNLGADDDQYRRVAELVKLFRPSTAANM